jgi:putative membrane protein
MMGFDGYGMLGGLGMGFGMVLWVVLIALVAWALVSFLDNRGKQIEEAPVDILKRRYAKGEISQPEYEQAKRNLD